MGSFNCHNAHDRRSLQNHLNDTVQATCQQLWSLVTKWNQIWSIQQTRQNFLKFFSIVYYKLECHWLCQLQDRRIRIKVKHEYEPIKYWHISYLSTARLSYKRKQITWCNIWYTSTINIIKFNNNFIFVRFQEMVILALGHLLRWNLTSR